MLDLARRARHLPWDAGMDAAADFRMLELDQVPAFHQDLVLSEVAVAHRGKRGHARALKRLGGGPFVALACPSGNYRVERGFVFLAQLGALEARVAGERRLADCLAERAPFIFGADRDRNPLIV